LGLAAIASFTRRLIGLSVKESKDKVGPEEGLPLSLNLPFPFAIWEKQAVF
jgi:hypothetical protein